MILRAIAIAVEAFWATALINLLHSLGQKAHYILSADVVRFWDKYTLIFWPSEMAVYAWPVMLVVYRILFIREVRIPDFVATVSRLCIGSGFWVLVYMLKYEYLPWLGPMEPTAAGQVFNISVVVFWLYLTWRKLRSNLREKVENNSFWPNKLRKNKIGPKP